jgi:hypothetical protein
VIGMVATGVPDALVISKLITPPGVKPLLSLGCSPVL